MSGRLPTTYGRLGKKRAENSGRRESIDSPSSSGASPSRPHASTKLRTQALAASSVKPPGLHSASPDPILLIPQSPSRATKSRIHHSPISKIVSVNPPADAVSVTPTKRKRHRLMEE
ncbi:hypothetical protein BS47DRAFT_740272 [Hydnum rufescens UP504]|uniref:Uncharacterized protein n=1 Tax=Hydnum rufescens UP504 TaxID=1448309 RepID=A0A9P6B2D7_9AGAM|nr:hypothetical protein BS47DRAFT_740272 [Hydnum rufescens UP504]